MQVERIPLPSRQWAEALVLPEAPHAAMHTVQYHVVVVPGAYFFSLGGALRHARGIDARPARPAACATLLRC